MNDRIYPTDLNFLSVYKNAIKELKMNQIRLSRILKIAKIWTW